MNKRLLQETEFIFNLREIQVLIFACHKAILFQNNQDRDGEKIEKDHRYILENLLKILNRAETKLILS